MIVCVAVVGHQNNPLYLQSFTDGVKLHYIVHCSLDVIDERVNNPKKTGLALNETFLGLLYPTENYKVIGSVLQEISCCLCGWRFKSISRTWKENYFHNICTESEWHCEVFWHQHKYVVAVTLYEGGACMRYKPRKRHSGAHRIEGGQYLGRTATCSPNLSEGVETAISYRGYKIDCKGAFRRNF